MLTAKEAKEITNKNVIKSVLSEVREAAESGRSSKVLSYAIRLTAVDVKVLQNLGYKITEAESATYKPSYEIYW